MDLRERYSGREGFRQFITDVDVIWDRFSIEPNEFRDLGDIVLVLGRVSARGSGSGVEVDSAAGYVLARRDAKVHRMRSFGDTQEALEAAGLAE